MKIKQITVYFCECLLASRIRLVWIILSFILSSHTVQADGSIRLYRIPNRFYRRVEVFYGGRWGTVCDVEWGMEEGVVACGELGRTHIPGTTQIFK